MTTDTTERGLERLVCTTLAGHPCDPSKDSVVPASPAGDAGWSGGYPGDYDREFCVDCVQLAAFLHATQPEVAEALALDEDGPARRRFLARLQGQISKRGTIDVLRHGIKHRAHDLDLFYGTPSVENVKARRRFEQNRFTVTRQLRYSLAETQRALDVALFINGLPVFTFELKNSLTKQTVADAVEQYRRDRDPREKLFEFGRCVAHFAADESQVRFCTHLRGKESWFLPFNRGWNDGAGTRPTPRASRLTTCGGRYWPGRAWPTSWRTTPRWWRRRMRGRAGGGESRSGRATTSSMLCAGCWPTPERAGRAAATWSSTRRQRQEQLHRLAGAPADRAVQGRRPGLRLRHRGHGPGAPRPQIRDTIRQYAQVGATVGTPSGRRSTAVHHAGQEDHHLDDPEVPLRS